MGGRGVLFGNRPGYKAHFRRQPRPHGIRQPNRLPQQRAGCLRPIIGTNLPQSGGKWNAFAAEPMQIHEFWPSFASDCILVDELTAVNTTHWEFAEGARGAATGFTGTVGFSLIPKGKVKKDWREYWDGSATVMQSLAKFAFYCGVGHHTTIGMGQSRVLQQAAQKRKSSVRR